MTKVQKNKKSNQHTAKATPPKTCTQNAAACKAPKRAAHPKKGKWEVEVYVFPGSLEPYFAVCDLVRICGKTIASQKVIKRHVTQGHAIKRPVFCWDDQYRDLWLVDLKGATEIVDAIGGALKELLHIQLMNILGEPTFIETQLAASLGFLTTDNIHQAAARFDNMRKAMQDKTLVVYV